MDRKFELGINSAIAEELGKTQFTEDQIALVIEPDPFLPGTANARLKESGAPIWAIVSFAQTPDVTTSQLIDECELSRDILAATFAYYQNHQSTIDAKILLARSGA